MNRERFQQVDLIDFLDIQVYPALFSILDRVFPEFNFQKKGSHWEATNETHTRTLPGSPRPDRVNAYENAPFGFKIHGGEFVTWLSYLNNGSPPRGRDFADAGKALAQLAGVPFPERELSPEEIQKAEEREHRQNLLETFMALAQDSLSSDAGQKARDYLKGRGFTEELVEGLGFGLYTTTTEVKTALRENGFTDEEIGYSAREVKQDGEKPVGSGLIYDGRWEGRLVNAWRDRRDRIVNIWARDLTGKAEDSSKYLMITGGSKASPYGLDEAKGKDLVLVEGFLDALSLRVRGIRDVIAVGGTDLTRDQVETLVSADIKSLTINLDYDGPDGAGQEGTVRALKTLAKAPFQVYVIDPVEMADNGNLCDKVDPDNYVRTHGVEAYKSLLNRKVNSFRYKAREIISRHSTDGQWTDAGLSAATEEAISFDTAITDPRKQLDLETFFWPQIREATGIDDEALEACRQAIREKQAREREAEEYAHLIRETATTLQEGKLEDAKALLRDEVDRLRSEERHLRAEPVTSVADELDAHAQRLERWRGSEYIGLPQKTLPGLDKATLGLRGLMLLAAAPNVGKTALAVQLGVDVVEYNPDACFLFLSLEMSRWDIVTRIKCRLAGLDWKTLVFGHEPGRGRGRGRDTLYTPEEMWAIQEAEDKLNAIGQRIRILDERNFPAPTVEKVLFQLEDLKARTGTTRAFLLVDYLQVWPIPAHETSHLRGELDADKWRIGAMKTLRDASEGDAVLAISEARKPSGGDKTSWGGDLSDIMGAARGSYTPDMVFLFRPFDGRELARTLGRSVEESLEAEKEELRMQGIAYNKLIIAKGRDGVLKDTFDLTFWYRQSRFEEGTRGDNDET